MGLKVAIYGKTSATQDMEALKISLASETRQMNSKDCRYPRFVVASSKAGDIKLGFFSLWDGSLNVMGGGLLDPMSQREAIEEIIQDSYKRHCVRCCAVFLLFLETNRPTSPFWLLYCFANSRESSL